MVQGVPTCTHVARAPLAECSKCKWCRKSVDDATAAASTGIDAIAKKKALPFLCHCLEPKLIYALMCKQISAVVPSVEPDVFNKCNDCGCSNRSVCTCP